MSRRKRRYFKAPGGPGGAVSTRGGWRSSWRGRLAIAFVLLAVILIATLALLKLHAGGGPELPRAAIIDELALTDPNSSLIEHARQTLTDAGYAVDYYPYDRVTVDLYRRLPARGYRLVIIRSHSAGENQKVDPTTHAVTQEPLVSLFTAEVYSTEQYVADQRAHRLDVVQIGHRRVDDSLGAGVRVADPPSDRYFGITPAFIESTAQGRFHGTTILLMGCDAVNSDGMAAALMNKGAGAVAGWDGPVTASHTDDALVHVLQHLIVDKLAVGDAVAATMSDIGPDPAFGAKFIAYPKS